MNQQRRRWTIQEDNLLKKLVAEGRTVAPIAKAICRTRPAIHSRSSKLGLRIRKSGSWTPQEDALLIKLVGQGKSDTEIEKLMPRSKNGIMQRRKYALGIDIRVRWTADENDHLKRLLSQGKDLAEIGKLLNRTARAVERQKERLGLKRIPVKISKDNPADIAQLVKFKMAGWTHEAIAEVFKVIPVYITNLLVANGFKGFCWLRADRPKRCSQWTEIELDCLRKSIKRGNSLQQIYLQFPHRSQNEIHVEIKQITRYWITPAEQAERKRLREKHMEWRVY